jgi:hypothetical protein
VPARFNVRKSIDSLSAQELSDFRRAVKQALALNDKRALIICWLAWRAVRLVPASRPLFLP